MICKILKEFKLYCYIEQINQKLASSGVRVDSHRIQANSGTKRISLAHPTQFRVDTSRVRIDSHSKSQKDALLLQSSSRLPQNFELTPAEADSETISMQ